MTTLNGTAFSTELFKIKGDFKRVFWLHLSALLPCEWWGRRFLNHSNIEAVPNKRQPGNYSRTTKNNDKHIYSALCAIPNITIYLYGEHEENPLIKEPDNTQSNHISCIYMHDLLISGCGVISIHVNDVHIQGSKLKLSHSDEGGKSYKFLVWVFQRVRIFIRLVVICFI